MTSSRRKGYLVPPEFIGEVLRWTAEATRRRMACRDLVLKRLGAANVARWCGVRENTVYQWLSRGSELEPFPIAQVLPVLLGASREGIRFDVSILWPPFQEVRL